MSASLELECRADGTLLKGAVAITGKAVAPPPKVKNPSSGGGQVRSGTLNKDKKRTASVAQANSPLLRPPPVPRTSAGTAAAASSAAAAAAAAAAGYTASTSSKAAGDKAGDSPGQSDIRAVKDTYPKGADQQRRGADRQSSAQPAASASQQEGRAERDEAQASLQHPIQQLTAPQPSVGQKLPDKAPQSQAPPLPTGLKRPAPSAASGPMKQQALVPKLRLELVKGPASSDGVSARGCSTAGREAAAGGAASERNQKPVRVRVVEAPSPPQAPAPSSSRARPAAGVGQRGSSGGGAAPSAAAVAVPGVGAGAAAVKATPSGPHDKAGSVRAMPTPRVLSLASAGSRSSPGTQGPDKQRGTGSRSAYLTMHAE